MPIRIAVTGKNGQVVRALRTLLVPVIHLSTDYVFDGDKKGAYVEEDPPSPGSVYGATKLAGELAVQQNIDEHVILRTAWQTLPQRFLHISLREA